MRVLLGGDFDDDEGLAWVRALRQALPEATWLTPEAAREDPGAVQVAVVANPPPGSLTGLPGLRLIQSLWAGVDRLLADPTLPPGVPVARMVDPAMTAAMAETVSWACLAVHRDFFRYAQQQRVGQWRQLTQRRADECRVLVLGLGEMGRAAAQRLAGQGYAVTGWSRSGRHEVPGVPVLTGDPGLAEGLAHAQIVVNLLPLTAATRGLLDARLFAALPAGAAVINLGRGAHLVEADLLEALDRGALQHAVLDVFQHEPLPADHAFWRHPQVTVLPHVAAQTDPRSASAVVATNLRALRDGRPLQHLVDRSRGY